jgi:hypothetical protein
MPHAAAVIGSNSVSVVSPKTACELVTAIRIELAFALFYTGRLGSSATRTAATICAIPTMTSARVSEESSR